VLRFLAQHSLRSRFEQLSAQKQGETLLTPGKSPYRTNRLESTETHTLYPELLVATSTQMHNAPVPALQQTVTPEIARRVIHIQIVTLVWMSVEALVSSGAAWTARSPALLGFGGDSAVELLSAVVVFRRFYRPPHEAHAEERAGKIAGVLLFVLAVFVVFAAALSMLGHVEPRPSPIGIALLIFAAVGMPWLAKQKRRLSAATGSAALRGDAAESAVCGYLALIALAALVVNVIWKVSWADPVAALALLPFIVHEGWEAMKGKPCCNGV